MIDEAQPEVGRTPVAVRVNYALFGLLAGLSLLNVFAAAAIPKFRAIFMDMLGGQPLPFLTRFVIGNSAVLLATSIFFPLSAAAALFLSRARTSAVIMSALNLVIVLQLVATVVALFIPLTVIITAMQAP